jgi:hypothetical protein
MVEERHYQWRIHSFMVRSGALYIRVYDLESFRFFFATMISLYNKWMFDPNRFGFPAPLMVTTFHMFVQFALAALLRFLWPHHFRPDRSPGRRDYMCVTAPRSASSYSTDTYPHVQEEGGAHWYCHRHGHWSIQFIAQDRYVILLQ